MYDMIPIGAWGQSRAEPQIRRLPHPKQKTDGLDARDRCLRMSCDMNRAHIVNFNGGVTIARRVTSGDSNRMPSNTQRKQSHTQVRGKSSH